MKLEALPVNAPGRTVVNLLGLEPGYTGSNYDHDVVGGCRSFTLRGLYRIPVSDRLSRVIRTVRILALY